MLRDLWHMWGQAIAITAVIACGVATFVMSLSTLVSLEDTRSAYYDRYRFAHVFAQLKRAPETLTARLREDRVSETDRREAYQDGAPATADGLYLVPKVIDT